ncbi:MAG: hypothetical protein OEV64_06585, partial [Desulfobulbaceae bacterium]|nr:hypothetical protein [Desulfobulbaceae bacterium]
MIDNLGSWVAGDGEVEFPGHEVIVLDVVSGGDERGHIHLRILAEEDTVGIHQHDSAIGCELAKNLGRVWAGDPVQRDGVAGRLDKTGLFTIPDAKAVPVDDRLIRTLGDGDLGRGWLADRGLASHHGATLRVGHGRMAGGGKSGSSKQKGGGEVVAAVSFFHL